MNNCFLVLLCAMVATPFAYSHQQPTTMMVLDVGPTQVEMNLHVPLNELELAFGHDVTRDPESGMALWGPAFREYLSKHIHPVTLEKQPWSVQVGRMTIAKSQQSQSGPFQELLVDLSLRPPPGASLRTFLLHYDLIMHQVVTHKAMVSVHSDWAGGRVEPTEVGIIAVNTGTARIEPFAIQLGAGSWWSGFTALVRLGMQHIREGTDHLLFLIVCLLPATLTVNRRTWGSFGGNRYSLVRLVRIATAFTLGHSATLLAGAVNWVKLPQQPVEILIACSILVSAIHAVRPVFPGHEAQIAAGFGLVHGLAFASVLSELYLSGGRLALSIFGFNLGIELMQLFVIAVTVPWLILLSLTPAHRWVRVGGALLAAVAAIGWILNRVSGRSNEIERLMTSVARFSPLGILVLALIAIPAYLTTAKASNLLSERQPIQ